jgi:hypothetical protein
LIFQCRRARIGNAEEFEYLLSTRYDRADLEAAFPTRVHQEDFSQAG